MEPKIQVQHQCRRMKDVSNSKCEAPESCVLYSGFTQNVLKVQHEGELIASVMNISSFLTSDSWKQIPVSLNGAAAWLTLWFLLTLYLHLFHSSKTCTFLWSSVLFTVLIESENQIQMHSERTTSDHVEILVVTAGGALKCSCLITILTTLWISLLTDFVAYLSLFSTALLTPAFPC